MDKAVASAYTHVMDMEPLPETATPRTKRRFAESAARVHHIVGLMHTHMTGIMTANDIEEDDDNFEEPEVSVGEKPKITAEARIEDIWGRYNDADSIEAVDWIDSLLRPRKLTLMEAEQDGFARLLAGYTPAERVQHLEAQLTIHGEFSQYEQRSLDVEANPDVMARLRERESLMLGMQYASAIHAFVVSVLTSMHAIRFACEWAELSGEQKAQLRNDVFSNIDVASYSVFQNRHVKVIKARNDLRRLFSKFGARVLMDPTWTPQVSYDTGKTGRSVTFAGTLKLFLEQADLSGVDMQESEDTLVQLLEQVLNESMMKYVRDFLDAYRVPM